MSLSSQTFRSAFRSVWPQTEMPANAFPVKDTGNASSNRARLVVICLIIFWTAIGVRLLLWQDNRPSFPRIFTGMVEHHKGNAHLLINGDLTGFIRGPAPPGDANILTYPPGYPIIMAMVWRLFGDSDTAMRIFQISCDAAAAVLLFLLAAELMPIPAAVIAGVLAAFSPQLAYYSLLLLPDSLATLPILLALYFIVRAKKRDSLPAVVAAGAMVGLSCWLRSNALLLAPFLAVVLLLVMKRERRWPSAAALLATTILVIAPITIRNLIVFHHLVPLSLGAGQMLNVGIGDYDKERKFGLPGTDMETVVSEAQRFNRPDYANSLFGGSGVERDQERMKRGVAVVLSHPGWFAKVVLRRGFSMVRLERVNTVSMMPSPTNALTPRELAPAWSLDANALMSIGTATQTKARFALATNGATVRIESADLHEKNSFVTSPITVEQNSDYLFRLPLKVEQGNIVVSIVSEQNELLASTPVFHPLETSALFAQPTAMVEILFVNRSADNVRVIVSNDVGRPAQTSAELGKLELFRLGPASLLWTCFFRVVVHGAQKFFLTVWILPLALIGILVLKAANQNSSLIILLAIPVYYLTVQSFLHTEYRYVMAIQHLLFVLAAATVYSAAATLLYLIRTHARQV